MKLPHPFFRLPLKLDAERLRAEVAQFEESDWKQHPGKFTGNSALRLISVDGAENDDFAGPMQPTLYLRRCPYIQQVLAQFGVVWSRSRLMRLAPGARVREHCDIDYHWFHRVRIHIPIVTDPAVRFTCDGQTVHMAAGESWIFDNLRLHDVHNGSLQTRIHLVADTIGNADFWRMALASQNQGFESAPSAAPTFIEFRPEARASLRFERKNLDTVMSPGEVEQLVGDLLEDLQRPQSAEDQRIFDRFTGLLSGFCYDWRALWSLYGDDPEGWPEFMRLRDAVAGEVTKAPPTLICAGNSMPATDVFHWRVSLYAIHRPRLEAINKEIESTSNQAGPESRAVAPQRFRRPVFIVAAPRSGSTLLFETLMQAPAALTFGGEAHALVEGLLQLRPQAKGIGSNRLTEEHVNAVVRAHIDSELNAKLRNRDGLSPTGDTQRFLEKTPKNALRIPFFNALFPDARFIFLWRDPRENISSIMQAWRAGGWQTYQKLPGWQGPWSMLVPPGYQALNGRPLEEVAAFQWSRTNEIILDDLSRLPQERWMSLSYAAFLAHPSELTRRICDFAELDFDERLAAYLARPLPLSAHTLTPPAKEKWRQNEAAIARVLPSLLPLQARLAGLGSVHLSPESA